MPVRTYEPAGVAEGAFGLIAEELQRCRLLVGEQQLASLLPHFILLGSVCLRPSGGSLLQHGAVKVCLILCVRGPAEASIGAGEIEVREDLGGVLAQELFEQVCGLLIVLQFEFALAQAEE